ncbi:hypothetical protein OTU49_015569 [Cherax quadricarinatus]|uniref:Uncharacterized protein n=3 Tax=Cherax quadricarinatus TaxID=27406 RepID=A0AAW0XZ64_CHEQU
MAENRMRDEQVEEGGEAGPIARAVLVGVVVLVALMVGLAGMRCVWSRRNHHHPHQHSSRSTREYASTHPPEGGMSDMTQTVTTI